MRLLKAIKAMMSTENGKGNYYIGNARWMKYAEWYPEEGQEGYDGIHNGGPKGIQENAPEDVKKEFYEFCKDYNENHCYL